MHKVNPSQSHTKCTTQSASCMQEPRYSLHTVLNTQVSCLSPWSLKLGNWYCCSYACISNCPPADFSHSLQYSTCCKRTAGCDIKRSLRTFTCLLPTPHLLSYSVVWSYSLPHSFRPTQWEIWAPDHYHIYTRAVVTPTSIYIIMLCSYPPHSKRSYLPCPSSSSSAQGWWRECLTDCCCPTKVCTCMEWQWV